MKKGRRRRPFEVSRSYLPGVMPFDMPEVAGLDGFRGLGPLRDSGTCVAALADDEGVALGVFGEPGATTVPFRMALPSTPAHSPAVRQVRVVAL